MIENGIQYLDDRDYLLSGLSLIIIILSTWLSISSIKALKKKI
jgi:hypothetical protein